MPYATLSDLNEAFGEAEIVRLTVADGELTGPADATKVDRALADATDLIDSYLRRRYAVPLADPVPAAIRRACGVLARFDLAHGDQREPTEQMRLARKDTIDWLKALADGGAELPGAVPLGGTSGAGARVSDRCAAFSNDSLRGW